MSDNIAAGVARPGHRNSSFDVLVPVNDITEVASKDPPAVPKPLLRHSRGFVATVITIFIAEYILYHAVILLPRAYQDWYTQRDHLQWVGVDAAIFHFVFLFVILSYIKCLNSDPGQIPRHWAFYKGDQAKRRRYCKECNAWKPERAHHCSACSRCVLNMDHHCPWINNCVGFKNRKYFMLLLIYGVCGLALVTFQCAKKFLYDGWRYLVLGIYAIDPALLATTGFFGFGSGFLLLAMIQFLTFHFRLVFANLTTIENLDRSTMRTRSIYNVGLLKNCQQVFGSNPLLWGIPYNGLGGAPLGDGIRWPVTKINETCC